MIHLSAKTVITAAALSVLAGLAYYQAGWLLSLLIPSDEIVLKNAYWVVDGKELRNGHIPEWRVRLPMGFKKGEWGINGSVHEKLYDPGYSAVVHVWLNTETHEVQPGSPTSIVKGPPTPWVDLRIDFTNQAAYLSDIARDYCWNQEQHSGIYPVRANGAPPLLDLVEVQMNHFGWQLRVSTSRSVAEAPEPLCKSLRGVFAAWTVGIDDIRKPQAGPS